MNLSHPALSPVKILSNQPVLTKSFYLADPYHQALPKAHVRLFRFSLKSFVTYNTQLKRGHHPFFKNHQFDLSQVPEDTMLVTIVSSLHSKLSPHRKNSFDDRTFMETGHLVDFILNNNHFSFNNR